MTQRVLLVGASGRIGRMLRDRLPQPGRVLRLFDIAPLGEIRASEEARPGDLTDQAAIRAACQDVDAIVHLGGRAQEAPWGEVQRVNVDGTRGLLEAARDAGVPRVVIASSFHVVGFRRWREMPDGSTELPAAAAPRPDSNYGWSKAAMEALGSLYADRFGLQVICVRIGTCSPQPGGQYSLSTWISPDDMARLTEAALTTAAPGFRLVWGVSANTRRWWSLAEGERIGYCPVDDAEVFADQIDPDSGLIDRPLGGGFCTQPLGQPFN